MNGVDIFILFALPALILAGSLGGLWILNRHAPAEPPVNAKVDLTNVVRFTAVGE